MEIIMTIVYSEYKRNNLKVNSTTKEIDFSF